MDFYRFPEKLEFNDKNFTFPIYGGSSLQAFVDWSIHVY